MKAVSLPYNQKHAGQDSALLNKIASATLSQAGLRIRLLLHELKYNPNQERVPRGNPDGGQWTDGTGETQPNTRIASRRRTGGPTSRLTPVQRIYRSQIKYLKGKINQINPRERSIEPLGGANSSTAHNSFKARYETLLSKSKTVKHSQSPMVTVSPNTDLRPDYQQSPAHTRFSDIQTREQYASRIYDTMVNGTHSRPGQRGKTFYYNSKTNTIVVVNPGSRDLGTGFPANNGLQTYRMLK